VRPGPRSRAAGPGPQPSAASCAKAVCAYAPAQSDGTDGFAAVGCDVGSSQGAYESSELATIRAERPRAAGRGRKPGPAAREGYRAAERREGANRYAPEASAQRERFSAAVAGS